MIRKLWGRVDSIDEDSLTLDVRGVGYHIHTTSRTLDRLSRIEGEVTLFIETVVREDMIRLYGFDSVRDRAWFDLLTSVQGIGARTALAILSVMGASELGNAVAFGDKSAFTRAPGVGAKVAQRLVNELKDKLPKALTLQQPADLTSGIGDGVAQEVVDLSSSKMADARSALINLGYNDSLASEAVVKAATEVGAEGGVDTIIKLALKQLMR